jgi:hypothetical protein
MLLMQHSLFIVENLLLAVGCWLLENYLPNPGEWVVGLPKTRLPLVFFGVIVITPPAASQLQ